VGLCISTRVIIGLGIAEGQKTTVEVKEPAMKTRHHNNRDKNPHSHKAHKTGCRNSPRDHSRMVRSDTANNQRSRTRHDIQRSAPGFAILSN